MLTITHSQIDTYMDIRAGYRAIDLSLGTDADGDGLVDMPIPEAGEDGPK
jgi:hypothetical protein